MAINMSTSTSTISDADRRLRLIQFFCFFPALGLGVPSATQAHTGIFALGTIPMSFSAIHALALLYTNRKPKSVRMFGFNVFVDVFLAVFLIAIMIVHWIGTAQGWGYGYYRRSQMLATFATMPMIVNFCIHTFFALNDLNFFSILAGLNSCSTCPHCQNELPKRDLRLLWDLTPGATASNSSVHSHATMRQGYVHLPAAEAGEYTDGDKAPETSERKASAEGDDEGTPRASMEDESSRLL